MTRSRSNSTNRKQIAKELNRRTSCGYHEALNRVEDAAQAGLLPAVLNQEGREEAVRILANAETNPTTKATSGERSSSFAAPVPRPSPPDPVSRGGARKTVSTAADVARILAEQHGDRVLLVDTDPPRPLPWHSLTVPVFQEPGFDMVGVDVPGGYVLPAVDLTPAEEEAKAAFLRQLRSPGAAGPSPDPR